MINVFGWGKGTLSLRICHHLIDAAATSLPATSCGFDVIEGQMVQQGAN